MRSEATSSIGVPAYDKMLWPTLQALIQVGGSGRNEEINDAVIEIERFTEAQQKILHGKGPQTEIVYRLAWARTYLRAVDAIENSTRGVWAITDYGRSLMKKDMTTIPKRVKAMSKKSPLLPDSKVQEVETLTGHTVQQLNSTVFEEWRDYLLETLLTSSPSAFERLCQRVLRESGFTKVDVTGRSGDGGIDGIGVLRISLLSFQVFFQCKRYKGSVGAEQVRNFRGAMVGRTDKGLLITTGTFTADAKKEATRDGAPVIDLIDGDQLCLLLKDLRLGVSTQQVEEVSIDPEWFSTL